jgi:hypothetical protein
MPALPWITRVCTSAGASAAAAQASTGCLERLLRTWQLARISHKFYDAKAILGKKLICRKGLASVRRVHPFRQSVFRP